jgi:hypothetical protein
MTKFIGTLGNDIFNISNNAVGDMYYGDYGNDVFNVKAANGLFINTDYGNDTVTLQGNNNFIDSFWVGLSFENFNFSDVFSGSDIDKLTIRGNDNTINGVNLKLNITGNENEISSMGYTKAIITGNNNTVNNRVFGLHYYIGDPDDITFNGNFNKATVDRFSTITIKGDNNTVAGNGLKVSSNGNSNLFTLDHYNGDYYDNYNYDHINNVSLRGNQNTLVSEWNILQGRITGNNNIVNSGFGADTITVTGNNNLISTDLITDFLSEWGSSGDKITVTGNDNVIKADGNYTYYGADLVAEPNPDRVTVTGDRNTIFGTLDDIITIRGNDNDIYLSTADAEYPETMGLSPDGSLLVKVLNASATNSLFLDFNYGSGETITLQKQGASLLLHVEDAVNLVSETLKITNQFVASGLFGVDSITSADGFTIDLRDASFIASASTTPSEWDASFWHSVV